jgi:predicted ATP-dependent endonuclease of OLD family
MAILRMKLDNILAFKDFEVNFSYPRKLSKSIILNEHLKDNPSFRYKKLNVFIGSNATGKTSLMKVICLVLNFMVRKEKQPLLNLINFKEMSSRIEMDLVDNPTVLNRIIIKTENNILAKDAKVDVSIQSLTIRPGDSYETRVKDFISDGDFKDYQEGLRDLHLSTGWNLIMPATEGYFDRIHLSLDQTAKERQEYLDILNSVLTTLDPSIEIAKLSRDSKNAIVIQFYDDPVPVIVQEGNMLSNLPRLSSGTKYGISIANIMYAIKNHRHQIYLIDEQFAYVTPDIEAALLSTMVSLLGPNEQLFCTTHNSNILSLNYPFHAFYFLRKGGVGKDCRIEISCASEFENRNNVSPKNLFDNDMFKTSPDVSKIYDIGA